MTKEEFVVLHGDEAWEKLVRPKQEGGTAVQRQHANAIVHFDVIMPTLRLLGVPARGILEARALIT